MRPLSFIALAAALLIVAVTEHATAHITPPVTFMSDREAVLALTTGAKRTFVREVKLTSDEQRAIESQWQWKANEPFYRFYVGRDDGGQIVSAVTFLTDVTIHGHVRVAVAIGPDGKVKGAQIIEVSEEISHSIKALKSGEFVQQFVGQDSRGKFVTTGSHSKSKENMVHFYSEVIARLIQRGAILFDVTTIKRGDK